MGLIAGVLDGAVSIVGKVGKGLWSVISAPFKFIGGLAKEYKLANEKMKEIAEIKKAQKQSEIGENLKERASVKVKMEEKLEGRDLTLGEELSTTRLLKNVEKEAKEDAGLSMKGDGKDSLKVNNIDNLINKNQPQGDALAGPAEAKPDLGIAK